MKVHIVVESDESSSRIIGVYSNKESGVQRMNRHAGKRNEQISEYHNHPNEDNGYEGDEEARRNQLDRFFLYKYDAAEEYWRSYSATISVDEHEVKL